MSESSAKNVIRFIWKWNKVFGERKWNIYRVRCPACNQPSVQPVCVTLSLMKFEGNSSLVASLGSNLAALFTSGSHWSMCLTQVGLKFWLQKHRSVKFPRALVATTWVPIVQPHGPMTKKKKWARHLHSEKKRRRNRIVLYASNLDMFVSSLYRECFL